MKTYLFTAVWGVFVWGAATLFFRIFGEKVLFPPGTDAFTYSTAMLLVGTAILLTLVVYLYTLLWSLKTPGYAGGSIELLAWGQKKPLFMIR